MRSATNTRTSEAAVSQITGERRSPWKNKAASKPSSRTSPVEYEMPVNVVQLHPSFSKG